MPKLPPVKPRSPIVDARKRATAAMATYDQNPRKWDALEKSINSEPIVRSTRGRRNIYGGK